MKTRRYAATLAVALLFSAPVALAQATVLRYPVSSDPAALESALVSELISGQIALDLRVGLFRFNADTELEPYLVSEWTVSDDGLVYTFTLRDDAKWHNGRAIVAADIKAGWERYLDPQVGAQAGGDPWRDVAGGPELYAGEAEELVGVQVLDDHTLQVTLSRPSIDFLQELALSSTWVVPQKAVVAGQPRWVDGPVGGGPFRFVEWVPGSRIVFEAFDDFFLGRPEIDRLEYVIVPDANTALAQFEAGELDIVAVPPAQLARVVGDPVLGPQVAYFTRAQLQYAGLNQDVFEPFRDPLVRQAFFQAIDRDTIAQVIQNGAWTNATGLVPPNIPEHNPELETFGYDPEAAREALAAAGYPGGAGFPALEIATLDSTVGEAIAAMIAANLGIPIQVIQPERGDMINGLWGHDRWQFFHFGWTASQPSASVWTYDMLYSGLDSNFSRYSNTDVDAAIDLARSTLDAAEATAAWQEAEQIALEDAALIPLGYNRYIYLVSPEVHGFTASLLGPLSFHGVSK